MRTPVVFIRRKQASISIIALYPRPTSLGLRVSSLVSSTYVPSIRAARRTAQIAAVALGGDQLAGPLGMVGGLRIKPSQFLTQCRQHLLTVLALTRSFQHVAAHNIAPSALPLAHH